MSKDYPPDWPKISIAVKEVAGWYCVRCGHPNEKPKQLLPCDDRCDSARHPGGLNDGRQRMLTVHHLDGNKENLAWWNLAALCQVCHLHIQGKVVMNREYMFEHSEWFKPYVAGWYAYKYLGLELNRDEVIAQLDELLNLERVL